MQTPKVPRIKKLSVNTQSSNYKKLAKTLQSSTYWRTRCSKNPSNISLVTLKKYEKLRNSSLLIQKGHLKNNSLNDLIVLSHLSNIDKYIIKTKATSISFCTPNPKSGKQKRKPPLVLPKRLTGSLQELESASATLKSKQRIAVSPRARVVFSHPRRCSALIAPSPLGQRAVAVGCSLPKGLRVRATQFNDFYYLPSSVKKPRTSQLNQGVSPEMEREQLNYQSYWSWAIGRLLQGRGTGYYWKKVLGRKPRYAVEDWVERIALDLEKEREEMRKEREEREEREERKEREEREEK